MHTAVAPVRILAAARHAADRGGHLLHQWPAVAGGSDHPAMAVPTNGLADWEGMTAWRAGTLAPVLSTVPSLLYEAAFTSLLAGIKAGR
jgi:hypothetical protein